MADQTRRQNLEEMLAADPGDTELRYMLAMEHVSEGDDAGAAKGFEELIARAPNYAPAYHQGGRALHRLGRIAEARQLLQRGIPIALQQGNEHAAGEMQGLLENLD